MSIINYNKNEEGKINSCLYTINPWIKDLRIMSQKQKNKKNKSKL